MRAAYADPPYIGQARKHYGREAAAAGRVAAEVDHVALIAQLETFDAWALSLSSPSLKQILAMCPDDVRVGAWVKPFASFKKGVDPAYAWEPVIYRTARKWRKEQPTCRDWVSANITLQRGVSGAKPDAFCLWLFELLGMQRSDDFTDLFPGSGAVGRAWDCWRHQPNILAARTTITASRSGCSVSARGTTRGSNGGGSRSQQRPSRRRSFSQARLHRRRRRCAGSTGDGKRRARTVHHGRGRKAKGQTPKRTRSAEMLPRFPTRTHRKTVPHDD